MKKRSSISTLIPLLFGLLSAAAPASAQRAYIPNYNSNTVSVINTATNSVVATIPVGTKPVGVAVSPDGTRVYTGNTGSSSVSVINTATNSIVATIPVGNTPQGVAISPDSKKLYAANHFSNSIYVISTATNTVINSIAINNPTGIIVSPDGHWVYVTIDNTAKLSVIDATADTLAYSVTVGGFPLDVAVTPDGAKVYVANLGSNSVSVVDVATKSIKATIPVGVNPSAIAVSPTGDKVYASNFSSNTVSVIDAVADTVIKTIPVGMVPRGVGVIPDGSRLYVANRTNNNVSAINTADYSLITNIAVGNRPDHQGVFISTYPVAFPGPEVFCIDAGVQTGLSGGVPAGGVYGGPGVTDDGNGLTYSFDPEAAGLGTHLISYTQSGLTARSGVTVSALPAVALTLPDTLYMTQASPQTGIEGGSPPGGVYSDLFGAVFDDDNGLSFSFNSTVAIGDTNYITYTYTDENGCANSISKKIVVAAPVSGVSGLYDLQGIVSPNPTSGIVELRGASPQRIRVIDPFGRQVLAQENPESSIDLSQLPPGVYTLLAYLNDGKWGSGKVVKQ
ncbi:MAG: beta-propeller fold lactonase family protein [Lewinellaceae bacterium]|nr:beta-propeller fold lactonase family protein [Lewinellaceae bacterium]